MLEQSEMNIIETDRGFAVDLMIALPHGLHARPSARLARTAREFSSSIMLSGDQGEADCKSMVEVLSLGLKANARARLLACGDDSPKALEAIYSLLTGNQD